ncbi:GntR family transcriptional regulator [Jannaschia marina]|uniref:GntR family transcriptional regulator n=1 Tax=Jannaschia marina TaxID=2741674 RepID=UPI0015CAAB39|nr:GntR family transcriptional regulator [Jannaschia marina]
MPLGAQTETLEDRVYLEIRDKILKGVYVSGQKLVQEDLAAELGVSRTPLRSAIAQLNREGLVRMSSRSEAYVAEFGPERIADLFELRAVLEGLICRLLAPVIERKQTIYLRSLMASVADTLDDWEDTAYREADIEFHTHLTKLAEEHGFSHLLEPVHLVMRMSLSHGILRAPAETYAEHIGILDALEARDPDAAERAMVEHIRKTIVLLRQRSETPDDQG